MAKRPENAVAEIRERIDALKAERQALQAKPASSAEVEASIDRYIDHHAGLYRARFQVERLKQRASLETFGEKDDAFFAFYFGDAIKAALMAEAADGMASTDRAAELERIDAALLDAEREEEKIIIEAEQRGHYITRRAAADPRAVLDFD